MAGPPAMCSLLLLAVSELCPAGSPCLGCPPPPRTGEGPVGGRRGGQGHVSWPVSHPPVVGSLNCSYGGVPALNFYIPHVLGFCRIYVHIGGGVLGGGLGECDAAARLGTEPSGAWGGDGTGAAPLPYCGDPRPQRGSVPRGGACCLWVPVGPGTGVGGNVPLPAGSQHRSQRCLGGREGGGWLEVGWHCGFGLGPGALAWGGECG